MPLLSTYRIPQKRGYSDKSFYIEDTSTTSPYYFDIQDFPSVMSGGRHIIKLKGNGLNMRLNSTIDIEILDANGQEIYSEISNYRDRFNNYYIVLDIYDITAQGIATAYLVGEAVVDLDGNEIPTKYTNQYNVRWSKQFNVLPFERNQAELLFSDPPQVSVAQIVTPARILTQATTSAYTFTSLTSSANQLAIQSSNFFGYDRDFQSGDGIFDSRIRSIRVNPLGDPTTMNSVPTYIRTNDDDIINGVYLNQTTRFNTVIKSTTPFFKKEHLGGFFEFKDLSTTPTNLKPTLPSGITASGSIPDQLSSYTASIVEIFSETQAILSKPVSIITQDANNKSQNTLSTFAYKDVGGFTGSITYVPSDLTYVTSSVVSQSYAEFTFGDLNPISGQVYRIRTSARLSSRTGDYKLLNDQIVAPVEYLTDAQYPNGLNYARHESDHKLIGHFTTQSVLDTYWTCYFENPNGFDVVSGSIVNNIQIESAKLNASYTQSALISTRYYQNYNYNQTYTLGFYLVLEPYTELELYMTSDPLNAYISSTAIQPRAFLKSQNNDKTRYPGSYTRFGKYIGKVVNNKPTTRRYGRVLFDFETDGNGLGMPVFRSKIIDQSNITSSAYISEVSIKPYTLNGYTPNIIQYAIPLPQDILGVISVSQSIDFKLDYYDYTGKQSEYTTFLDDVVLNLKADITSNTCQTDKLYFYYNSANNY
jgi:hypothetical protein